MKTGLSAVAAVLMSAVLLSSCAAAPAHEKVYYDKNGTPQNLSGSIDISGSSALEPLAQAAADSLKQDSPDLAITVSAGGSGKGLTDIVNKSVDIGCSDVPAGTMLDEKHIKGLLDHKICVVGIAVAANKDAGAGNLTQEQLIGIFTGRIKNWKEAGGNNVPIVLINRPPSSGTRAIFRKYALKGMTEAAGTALQQDDSGLLAQTIAQTKGAVGYLALAYTKGKNDIKLLSLDGSAPTYKNIYGGKYPVWSYEHMYTGSSPDSQTKAYIKYISGGAFAGTVEKMGYGVYDKMKVKR